MQLMLCLRNETHLHILHSHHVKRMSWFSNVEHNTKGKIHILKLFVWM